MNSNELAGSRSVEDSDIDRIPAGTSPATMATEKDLKVEEAVTGEPSEPSFTRLGQLGVPAFTERFTNTSFCR